MDRRRTMIIGAALIVIGALALLNILGLGGLGMESLWPAVVIVGGVALAVAGLGGELRQPDNVGFGITAALCGGVFLYITVGPGEWEQLAWMWPVFPVAAGFGGVVAWLTAPRRVSALVGALIPLGVGVIGFLYTAGRLGDGVWRWAADYWPLVLVLIGAALIVEFFLNRGHADRS